MAERKKGWKGDRSIRTVGTTCSKAWDPLAHTHEHTHPYTNNQNKQTIAARGQFSLLHSPLHRQMRSWPPTDNLPPCPLHRCITSPQSSNCQAWSFQYTTLPHHGHGAGQAECVAPLMNWVNNWWKLTLVIWPLNHPKQPNMGVHGDLEIKEVYHLMDVHRSFLAGDLLFSFFLLLHFLTLLSATIQNKGKNDPKMHMYWGNIKGETCQLIIAPP